MIFPSNRHILKFRLRAQEYREKRATRRRERGRCAAHRADDIYYGEEGSDEVFLQVETMLGTRRHDMVIDWLACAERAMACRECNLDVLWKLSAPRNDGTDD